MNKKRKSWRPSPKQDYVLNEMRQRIVGGQYLPGSRLPLRRELEKEFDVSWLTIQRAFDRLREDGVVKPRGRAGTFVVDHPPHVCHYALVSSGATVLAPWLSRVVDDLQAEAPDDDPCRITMYCDKGGDRLESSYRKLVDDIEAHRLAGVVFRGEIKPWANSPLVNTEGLPKVILGNPKVNLGVPRVCPDWSSFVDRAFDHLASAGARNVAVLTTTYFPVGLETLVQGIRRRGMTTQPWWIQYVGGDDNFITGPDSAQAVRHLTQLLVNPNQAERPDALLVVDDNMLGNVSDGIRATGGTPDDLRVVCHYSHPYPVPCDIPVRRLGFDTRKLVGAALERIDQQRRGQAPVELSTLPALFEDEMD